MGAGLTWETTAWSRHGWSREGKGARRRGDQGGQTLDSPARKLAIRLSAAKSHWKVSGREIECAFFFKRISLDTVFRGE